MPAKKKAVEVETRRRGFFFPILMIAILVAGTWFWIIRSPEAPELEASTRVKSTLHLETFVLNLADPDQRSYLRVGIDLGLGRDVRKGENAPPVAQMRDTILSVLGEARVEELQTEKGKSKLKDDLLRALQERAPGQSIEEVYFTEFLIQR